MPPEEGEEDFFGMPTYFFPILSPKKEKKNKK